MKIANLDELRKNTNENSIKQIVTEYMMETIARNTIMDKLENYISNKSDDTTITIRELKDKIAEFSATDDLFEDQGDYFV